MIQTLLLGLGMVLVIEGLVFSLAPARIDELLEFMKKMPLSTRRGLGLAAVAAGVLVIWLVRAI